VPPYRHGRCAPSALRLRLLYAPARVRRALPAFLAFALFACESPFAGSDPPPAPALAPDSASAAAAWPTLATYDLAADIALRSSFAHDHFYPFTDTTVQDGVFVVAELYHYCRSLIAAREAAWA
jgi:hypothetical protein